MDEPEAQPTFRGSTHPLHSHCIMRVPTPVLSGCPLQRGGGMRVVGTHSECSKRREALCPSPACGRSEIMSTMCPCPRRAPRGRRDEDRCRQHRHGLRSEHGEWPRYWPGRRAYADAKWTGPRALCVWLAVTSPGPRDPSPSALPTLAHTPSGPGLYFQHTHGLLRVLRRKRARHYLGKDG